jgi:hypothetical protein
MLNIAYGGGAAQRQTGDAKLQRSHRGSPTPPVATRFSRFRQFVDRFRQNPIKIHRKIGNFAEKNKVTNSGGSRWRGGSDSPERTPWLFPVASK